MLPKKPLDRIIIITILCMAALMLIISLLPRTAHASETPLDISTYDIYRALGVIVEGNTAGLGSLISILTQLEQKATDMAFHRERLEEKNEILNDTLEGKGTILMLTFSLGSLAMIYKLFESTTRFFWYHFIQPWL